MTDYAIYDVFTDTAFGGNPLAVVFDADGFDDDEMQTIAREFNLSETTFVRSAEHQPHSANVRIFTPGRELPFAGHPTVGTSIALAERRMEGKLPDDGIDVVEMLEEKVGPVRCAVRLVPGEPGFAEFDLPRTSSQIEASLEPADMAAACSAVSARLNKVHPVALRRVAIHLAATARAAASGRRSRRWGRRSPSGRRAPRPPPAGLCCWRWPGRRRWLISANAASERRRKASVSTVRTSWPRKVSTATCWSEILRQLVLSGPRGKSASATKKSSRRGNGTGLGRV